MKLLLFFPILVLALSAQAQYLTQMQQVADIPIKISNNAVVEGYANDTGYVYSFGGIDSTKIWSGITKKSFRYNTVTDIWDTIPDLPNTNAVIAAGASYVDSIIYIMGGYQVLSNGNEISSNIVNRFDPRTNTYLSDGANIPIPIDDHVQAVWNDSLIYVITGWSNNGNVPNVQIYDPANDNWITGTSTPNNNLYKAFGASGIIIGNTIYYHGGAVSTGNFPGQSTLRIGQIDPNNPTQITWTTSSSSTSEITYRSTPAYFQTVNNFVVWLGGSSTTYNYNGIAYNGSGGVNPRNYPIYYNPYLDQFNSYTLYNPSDTLPMDLRGCASFPSIGLGYVYITGGMENGQKTSNKTYKIWIEVIIGIDEKEGLNSFKVYPNPTSQQINLDFEVSENKTITLIDILGKTVYQTKSSENNLQIDVSNYPKGVYFVQVKTEKDVSSLKIVVE